MKTLYNLAAIIVFISTFVMLSCGKNGANKKNPASGPPLFEQISEKQSGISFSNLIKETKENNYMNFNYLYMSGGAGIGDFNLDGLPDVYFAAAQGSNKLYINKGNFQFEDITEKAGVSAANGSKTGVAIADVNADGYPDIYVCLSGTNPADRVSKLFINNKNLTFTERAAEFGLDNNCSSTQANFFDFDLDGDLDMYLVNHPSDFSTVSKVYVKEVDGKLQRIIGSDDEYSSDRLYRNDGNKFVDISKQAGINNRAFGLSATTLDANYDGFPDLYIANDYIEPDQLFINNGNGTFTDHINDYFRHMPAASMGADLADINNDGLLDLFVLDMAYPNNFRDKTNATAMMNERYYSLVQYGYGEQISRNMLQVNNGNGTYSEMACLSGIEATEWSWAPLMVDFDSDGWNDIFISNGFRTEVQNLDFVTFVIDSTMRADGGKFRDTLGHIKSVPRYPISNFVYRNKGDLSFEDVTEDWGFGEKTYSNSAVYADLDNDGDQDIIVIRSNGPAGVFCNKSVERNKGNYLQIKLDGASQNPGGVCSTVKVTAGNQILVQYTNPIRGFISTSTDILQFGLGKEPAANVQIQWPDGKVQTLENVPANQRITLKFTDAVDGPAILEKPGQGQTLFSDVSKQSGLNVKHKENSYFDFDRERLLPHKYSNQGPALAVGDVNGDGLDDLYIGGSFTSKRYLCIQGSNGRFSVQSEMFTQDSLREDTGAAFFDADGDKDLDLYVVSGGNEAKINSPVYQDRLYLNDGKGKFALATDKLPKGTESGSCVTPYDYDNDGDLDLFVGGRVVPGNFPNPPFSFVLQNNNGNFSIATGQVAPELREIGMVTDIIFADLNKDGQDEMIVCGEWMAIEVLKKQGKQFVKATADFGLDKASGWWNTIVAADFDGDGDLDLVAGNEGLNTRYHASAEEPMCLYAKDFDQNGSIDPLLCWFEDGVCYPVALHDPIIKQLPELKKRFLRFDAYAKASIEDIYPKDVLQTAIHLEATGLRSCYFENNNGKFIAKPLPVQAQTSPVKGIIVYDFDGNGTLDLFLAGNDYGPAVEINRYDAGNGTLLSGDGKGNFTAVANRDCGFWASREVRHLASIRMAGQKTGVVVVNNNSEPQLFYVNPAIK
ncbi:MAG: VCBS repeat-containing protein [Saprospiraceae bacterium]